MANVDFHSAYRDSTRGSTIQALQLRQKQLQEQMAQSMQPRQVGHPMQAFGQIANTLSAGIREGRAAAEEQAGRARFAELLAGGLSQDEMGEAIGLDPETALKYQQNTWDTEKEQRAAAARAAELQQGHTWDVEKAAAAVEAEKAAAEERARVEAESQTRLFGHQDKTAEELAREQEAADKLKFEQEQKTAEELAREQEKAKTADRAAWGPVTPEIAAKYGGDVAKNPGNYHFNATTGDVELINPTQFTAAEQEKRTTDTKSKLSSIDTGLDELNRALEIAPDVTEFGSAGRAVLAPSGMLPESWQPDAYKKTADATKRFDQITQSAAIQRMAAELAGSDSDKDVQRFMAIMADPNSSLTLKKQTLSNMINTLQRERSTQAERLKGITGEDIGAYKYTNPDVLQGQGATTPPAEGGGGGGAPVFDPNVDEEGDTGTDDQGNKWIVKGGKWVRS